MKQKIKSVAAKWQKVMPECYQYNAAERQKKGAERSGPQPLSMHLYTHGFPAVCRSMALGGKTEYREQVLQILSNLSADMKRGMDDYRAAVSSATRVPQEIIWRDGSTVLLRYPSDKSGKNEPILLVPSLINKADVLDLDQGHSFTQFLVSEGYDVYTLVMGEPGRGGEAFPQSITT